MCEYRLYQPFHLYIDSETIRNSPNLTTALNNIYYSNYNITIMTNNISETFDLHSYVTIPYKQSVSETILSNSINMPPNTIAIYMNPSITDIDNCFLFEINKWFLYRKCRATYLDTIWICKMGILQEIIAQIGMVNVDLLSSIIDVCGFEKITEFTEPKLLTICNTIISNPTVIRCKELCETVHVLLATYNRNANMREVLNMIQSQTNKNIHLHILDNNIKFIIHNELDSIITDYDKTMNITIHRPGWNSHCFGRITCIRKLMEEYLMEYIVIFDDDQIFEPNWIENMMNDRKPLSTFGWYGKLFNTCDYWANTISYWTIQNKKSPNITEFTYFGPGGCMLDINLFLFDEIYDYKKYSENILAIDDIWLSFVFKKYLNIPFYRNRIHPIKCIDRNDHSKMTWANIKDQKKDLMTKLSTLYDWDVTKPTPTTFAVNGVFERVYMLGNKRVDLLNICATYIPIETDIQTTTQKLFESAIQKGIDRVLILYEDVVFDDFFHYKFDKYMRNIPEKWDNINLDNIIQSKINPIIGYNKDMMLKYIDLM